MQAPPSQLAELATLFLHTLDPAHRRQAESQLTALEANPQNRFSLLLLQLIASPNHDNAVRLAAAIKLKNLCKRAWNVGGEAQQQQGAAAPEDDEPDIADSLITPQDRDTLKEQLFPLLLQLCQPAPPASSAAATSSAGGAAAASTSSAAAAPIGLRLQLSDTVSVIAERDFPDRWPGLIDVLVQGLHQSSDSPALGAVLQTSHSIFRRWRAAFRSDSLYTKINFVLERFAPPYLELLKNVDASLAAAKPPSSDLSSNYLSLLQLYHDLSAQDLPPLFEDNLALIMSLFLRWLNPTGSITTIPNPGAAGAAGAPQTLPPLYTSNDALSPPLEGDWDDANPSHGQRFRAEICSIAQLYAQRYLDAFEVCVPEYVKAVWEMLGGCGKGEKYDLLVSRAMAFLSTIVRMPSQRSNFEADATLEAFVDAIVLPNISLREQDEEMFEDEPMEWVRREFSVEPGGEGETRRSSASSFTKALLEQFPQQITSIISRYINQYLAQSAQDPKGKWRLKDTAVYLLTSIASTGSTASHGASSMNQLVNVVQFFSENVFGDLQSAEGVHPILQVDAIKYLYTFRSQLTKEQLLSVLPLLVRHLESANYVTCTYAAITIERVLFLKTGGKLLFAPNDVQPFAESILTACLRNIEGGGTPEKIAENDFLMKCVMRIIFTSRQALAPAHAAILSHLTSILTEISKNPSNPRFSQFCFESVSGLLRFVVDAEPTALAHFEEALSAPFMAILQNDVAEFVPYVFQVLAQMLELQPAPPTTEATMTSPTTTKGLPQSYVALLPSLLTPALWQSRGNVPALVRLVQAYVSRGGDHIVAHGQLAPILGIYQTLLASRVNDEYGLQLLLCLFESLRPQQLEQYRQAVLTLMLTRLQTGRTEKFARGVVVFVASWLCVRQPGYPEYVVQSFEAVQPGLFSQILQGVIVAELPKVQSRDKRVVGAGLARLLTESEAMLRPPNVAVWPSVLAATTRLLLDPSLTGSGASASAGAKSQREEDEEIFARDWEEQGYQANFSVLAASAPTRRDRASFAGDDVARYLALQLRELAKAKPGALAPLVQQMPQEAQASLQQLIAANGVTLA